MALAIATNNAASFAAASASSVNRDMDTSMARLSTGLRINSARDDAAGVAIASRLSSEIRGTDQSIRNALDGQALIDTAEGGHKEIENILQRLREISVQSANDTNDRDDRLNLQAEMNALITEIDRIASVTTWAGQSMFAGESQSNKTDFSFQVGTRTGAKNQIGITLSAMSASALGLSVSSSGSTPAVGTLSNVTFPTSGFDAAGGTLAGITFPASGFDAAGGTLAGITFPASGGVADTIGAGQLTTGKFTPDATAGGSANKIIELNNLSSATSPSAAILNFPQADASGVAGTVTIDYSNATAINATVVSINNAWNASKNLTGIAFVTIASVGATGGDLGDADDGKIVLSDITGLTFNTDVANTTPTASFPSGAAGEGVITFAASNSVAALKYTLANNVYGAPSTKVFTIDNGDLTTSAATINTFTATTGITATIVAAGSPEAGKLEISYSTPSTATAAAIPSATNGTFDETVNQIITAPGVTATADGTMTAAGVFTPGTGKASVVINLQNAAGANVPVTITAANSTQVTAAEVKAAIDSTSGHKYTATDNSDGTVTIAEYTGVTASADGTMTSAGVFTTTAGKSAATLNLNGTSVGPVDTTGDNDADALAIATAINSGTSTHKYTASHSTDGSGQVTISAGPVNTSVASADQARAAISVIDLGIKAVNTQRSELGAVSNRLSHTVNNLTNISSNLSAAKGGIEDADFAFETTSLAKNQILQQASTAMLAQANASKQNVLSLLQG